MATATDLGVSDVLDVVSDVFRIEITTIRNSRRGPQARFLCPSHPDNEPSADINLDSGLWSCFSCGARGDLAGLGVVVLKKPREEVVGLLRPGTPDAVLAASLRKLDKYREKMSPKSRDGIDVRNKHTLSDYRSRLSLFTYLYGRGFTDTTIRAWNVRYVDEADLVRLDEDGDDKWFTITHSIAIPIYTRKRKLRAWAYRKTDDSADWQPKVLYTPNFDLSSTWFGLNMVDESKPLHIVEGPLDAMWLWQCGYQALAMMGSNHQNGPKFRYLERFPHVMIVPDYDNAGAFMAERLGLLLRGRVPCSVARYPRAVVRRSGKEAPDPQDLSPEDVRLVVERAIPWQTWSLRNGIKR